MQERDEHTQVNTLFDVTCNSEVIARTASATYGKGMSKIDPTHCPVARTAAVVGGRWTALILRDLLLSNACRYQDLLESLAGIPPSTLSERLKMLEANGIVERKLYEQHPPRAEYMLTDKGRELGAIVRAMRDWGRKHG